MSRNIRRKERLSGLSEINVTPLIDLAFALLIIFMIAAPLLESTILVDLPEANSQTPPPATDDIHTSITIDKSGKLFFNDDPASLEDIEASLEVLLASNSKKPIVDIRADKNTQYANVVQVIDLLKEKSIHQIALNTLSTKK